MTDCIALVLKRVLACNCAMRNIKSALGLAAAISLALAAVALAADAKFRADGTIQRMSGDMVLVRTSAQDIEIKRDAKTKVTGELRRGGSAAVVYTKVGGENVATEIIMGGAISAVWLFTKVVDGHVEIEEGASISLEMGTSRRASST